MNRDNDHPPFPPSAWTVLLAFAVLAHVAAAPFTKVEESFGMQAAHDILFHGADVSAYDHHAFPGVVPRSFVAPALTAALAAPAVALLRAAALSKLAAGVAVRVALASLGIASLCRLRGATARVHGATAGAILFALSSLQFHLPFYLSRPLPNTYALVVTALATADWIDGTAPRRAVALLAATTALVRCDVLLLAGVLGLHMLATRAIGFREAVVTAAVAGGAAALASVAVDSVLWRRLLWPEATVLWFNTAENRSSEWGTSPWHWYASSALPRALLGGAPAVVAAALGAPPTARAPALAAAAYTALYSCLPHKELRFLLPVLPLFNVAAAAALAAAWRAGRPLARAAVVGLLAATAAATAGFSAAAAVNYPGGAALRVLHVAAANDALHHPHAWPPRVHVGVLPAMTGVTRFGEAGAPWSYSKEEGLADADLAPRGFTHALSSSPSLPGFDVVAVVDGYAGLDVPRSVGGVVARVREGGVPVTVRTAPAVWVHRRRSRREEGGSE